MRDGDIKIIEGSLTGPIEALTTPAAPREPPTRLVHGKHGEFYVLATDTFVGASLAKYGEYSPAELDFLLRLIEPDDHIIEAGANIGSLTIPLARRLADGSGRLWAFEPQPVLVDLLRRNVMVNGLGIQVILSDEALGAAIGTMPYRAHDYDRPGNFGDLMREDPNQSISMTMLDRFDLPRCDLIKIDVEGDEAAVILGAMETIARHRPLLYLEADRDDKKKALIELIESLDYRCFWHLPPLWRADNFNGDTENIFPGVVSVMLLAVPQERC